MIPINRRSVFNIWTTILSVTAISLILLGGFFLVVTENDNQNISTASVEETLISPIKNNSPIDNQDTNAEIIDFAEKKLKEDNLEEKPVIINKPKIDPKIINAKSYLALKVENGKETILEQKNINLQLPVASLTKIMTALIVLESYNLSEEVVVNDLVLEQIGEQGQLKLGEKFLVKDLLYSTLIESSNRAAFSLSKFIFGDFVKTMNDRAIKLDMQNTNYEDSMGLNSKSSSTAYDTAVISRHLYENYPLFRQITGLKSFDINLSNETFHHTAINTNIILGENNIVAGKTGWTPEARGTLMVIQDNPQEKSYIIYVVLGAEDRFLEMNKLINLTNNQ